MFRKKLKQVNVQNPDTVQNVQMAMTNHHYLIQMEDGAHHHPFEIQQVTTSNEIIHIRHDFNRGWSAEGEGGFEELNTYVKLC